MKNLFKYILVILISLFSIESVFAQGQPPVFDPGVRLQQDLQQKELEKQEKDLDYTPIRIEKEKPKEQVDNQPCVPVGKIILDDHLPSKSNKPRLIALKYEQQCLKKSQIITLLSELNQSYTDLGYFQAQAYIEKQDQETKDLIIDVYPSRLEEIVIKDKEDKNNGKHDALRFLHSTIDTGEIIYLRDLEATVDSLNANPALKARLAVKPGSQPNTSKVEIAVEEKDRIRGTLGFNNQGQGATGLYRLAPGIEMHNAFNIGETLGLNYVGNSDSDAVVAYFKLPLQPTWSLTGNYVYSDYLTQFFTGAPLTSPLINFFGEYTAAELALNKELFRKYGWVFNGSGGFRFKSTARELNSNALANQEERIVFSSLNATKKYKGGIFSTGGEISLGLPILGGSSIASGGDNSIPDGRFVKLLGYANLIQKVPFGLFSSSINGQWMPQAAFPVEHIILGGLNSIRGYREGVVSGEVGLMNRNEYTLKPEFKNKYLKQVSKTIQPAVFLDHGITSLAYNAPSQVTYLASIGAGLKVNLLDKLGLSIYYGYPLSRPGNLQTRTDGRLHFNISYKGF